MQDLQECPRMEILGTSWPGLARLLELALDQPCKVVGLASLLM